MESQARGGTRWKRFAVVMVPSVAATAAVGVALAQGALAASFSVSGQSFKVSAEKLDGKGMTQYGGVDVGTDMNGKKAAHAVAISGFDTAEITKLCQSVVTPDIPLLGTMTMVLEAGGNGTPVEAKNIFIDSEQLDADATFTNIDIGVAAGHSTKGPGIAKGDKANPNGFAQQAERAVLTDVEQTSWATSAGTFKLSGLKLGFKKGSGKGIECF